MKNRNSYKRMDARYLPNDIQTQAWLVVYKDITGIFLQMKEPLAVIIMNKDISESFEAYFQDLWKQTKPFKE